MQLRIRRPDVLLLGLLTAGLSACAGDAPAAPESLRPCMDDVTVTVSAGTTPTFTWTPACTVWSILVEERYTDRWRIVAQSEIGIAPGVRYGTVPDGATETIAALPLTAGREHDVNLFGGTPTTPLLVAVQTFTP